MTFFDKIKGLGSRIIKPVKKPISSVIGGNRIHDLLKIQVGGKDAPYPKKALGDNGGHAFVKPNGGIGWVSYK